MRFDRSLALWSCSLRNNIRLLPSQENAIHPATTSFATHLSYHGREFIFTDAGVGCCCCVRKLLVRSPYLFLPSLTQAALRQLPYTIVTIVLQVFSSEPTSTLSSVEAVSLSWPSALSLQAAFNWLHWAYMATSPQLSGLD